jgi:hypothetical protein
VLHLSVRMVVVLCGWGHVWCTEQSNHVCAALYNNLTMMVLWL